MRQASKPTYDDLLPLVIKQLEAETGTRLDSKGNRQRVVRAWRKARYDEPFVAVARKALSLDKEAE